MQYLGLKVIYNLWETCKQISKVVLPFYILTNCGWVFWSTLHWYLIVILIFIFFKTNNVKHFFMSLLAIYISYSVRYLSKPFVCLKIGFIFYIFWIQVLRCRKSIWQSQASTHNKKPKQSGNRRNVLNPITTMCKYSVVCIVLKGKRSAFSFKI